MKIAVLLIYEVLCRLIAFVCVPFVVLAARWDTMPTTFTGGAAFNGPATIRGDLPWWLAWFETFDERLPGGMYEPTVRKVYEKAGAYWCSVYWLNRNAMFGLTKFLFGKDEERTGYEWRVFGPIKVGCGWKKYRATPAAHHITGPFVYVLSATVRLSRDE